jgi:hypothetical protein
VFVWQRATKTRGEKKPNIELGLFLYQQQDRSIRKINKQPNSLTAIGTVLESFTVNTNPFDQDQQSTAQPCPDLPCPACREQIHKLVNYTAVD